MPKLNKSEALQAAKRLAHSDTEVNRVTLQELELLDYTARRALAQRISFGHDMPDTHRTYIEAARDAFIDGALTVWSRKERALETAKRSFRNAYLGMSHDEAMTRAADILTSMNIRGARVINNWGVMMEVDRGRASARLTVKMDRDEGHTNPDDDRQSAGRYKVTVEVSFTGSTHTLPEAELAMKVQREVLDAANEVQAILDREHIVWVRGFVREPATLLIETPVEAPQEPVAVDLRD